MLRQSGAHHRKQGTSRKRVLKPERHDSFGLQRNFKESDASHGRDEREVCTTYSGDGRGGYTTYPGDYPYPPHYYGGRAKVDQSYYDSDFDYGGIYETPKGDPRSYEAWSMYPPESTNPYDGRPAVEHTSVEKHTSSTNPSTSYRRGRGRAALAKSKPTATDQGITVTKKGPLEWVPQSDSRCLYQHLHHPPYRGNNQGLFWGAERAPAGKIVRQRP